MLANHNNHNVCFWKRLTKATAATTTLWALTRPFLSQSAVVAAAFTTTTSRTTKRSSYPTRAGTAIIHGGSNHHHHHYHLDRKYRPCYSLPFGTRRSMSWTSPRAVSTNAGDHPDTTTTNDNAADAADAAIVMQHLLYRIRAVNDMPADIVDSLWTFAVDGIALGKIRPKIVQLLCDAGPDVFVPQPNEETGDNDDDDDDDDDANNNGRRRPVLTLSSSIPATCTARTAAVDAVLQTLRHRGVITGWRNEMYPIARTFSSLEEEEPILLVERAAVPFLGALEYGVHMNGLVVGADAEPNKNNHATTTPPIRAAAANPNNVQMWMARRSATKSKFPGMLDHIVAGGQPAGLSLWDNAIKECQEEAGIPADVARAGLVPVGAVSYQTYNRGQDTITRCVLFNYDLYLPPDFTPTAVDGEVQDFFLWTVPDLLRSMDPRYPDPIKPNCYLVIIDWLLRAGHVSPDTPGYLDVLRELRSGDCQ